MRLERHFFLKLTNRKLHVKTMITMGKFEGWAEGEKSLEWGRLGHSLEINSKDESLHLNGL